MNLKLRYIPVLALLAALLAFAAAPAQAEFGLTNFSVSFEDKEGNAVTQAGAHPFAMNTNFDVETKPGSKPGEVLPDGDPKSLHFEFPPGFIGSVAAVPRCNTADFLNVDDRTYNACPNATAIGVAWTQVNGPGEPFTVPVYNLVPPPGVAAKIGFVAYPKIPITVEVGVGSAEPNNIVANVVNIPQVVEFYGSSLQLWGIPADPAHDPYRGRCLEIIPVDNYGELVSTGEKCGTNAAEIPFLTMPRSCTGPLHTSYEAISWQQPNAVPDKGSFDSPGMSGCSNLGFAPRVTAEPTSSQAEAASGLDFGIDINDEGLTSPSGPATQSDVKNLVVRMPAGMTLNSSAANGLSVCPRARYEEESLTTAPGQGCPLASKIGEVEVETPILPEGEILHGSVFLASQDDNPFGSLIALYVVFKNPKLGVLIKRAGKVESSEERGPNAGQIVTTFVNFPQTPFSHLRFRFNQGARAPLITPPSCGTYTTDAGFTPWADPSSLFSTPAVFDITSGVHGGPCPPGGVPPFTPGFSAGSLNNNAGAYSPFSMRLTRSDGQQDMTRFDAALPRGVIGKIAGLAKCPDSAIAIAKAKTGRQEIAAPSCPAGSEIGHTMVGSGVGSVLTYVPGKLYLAGRVGNAPLSVISITPAVAGPFDVGTVVLREALSVDPETAEVTVDGALSDPIPNLLKGIPIKVRDIRVSTDRPNFTLNPTSCARKESRATLFGSYLNPFSSADDVPVSLSDRYQAASCASLKFKPNISLRLKGGSKRGAYPALSATVSYPPGQNYANTRKAIVTFPHSMFLAQEHIRTVCTRVQFRADQCPAGSIYGKVRATTPLLDETVEGKVYLRSSSNPLPDLVFAFRGGVVDFNAVARVDSVNASLRVNFESIPDVPLSKVVVQMQGGKKGLIVNSRNLCVHKSRVKADFTAQSGKAYNAQPVIKVPGCGGKKSKQK